MITNVYFDDIATNDDWNLVFITKSTPFPDIKEQVVDIPLTDGVLDYSEVATGRVEYERREIKMQFYVFADYLTWHTIKSQIAKAIHGKNKKIVFDDELDYFYYGRVAVSDITYVQRGVGKLTITAQCKPFKYAVVATNEPWIWDSFNFEAGIIQELYDLEVDGSLEVSIICNEYSYGALVITTDTAMTVTYDEETYNLAVGDNTMFDILLSEGENTLEFTGTGTVTINYRGGEL